MKTSQLIAFATTTAWPTCLQKRMYKAKYLQLRSSMLVRKFDNEKVESLLANCRQLFRPILGLISAV